MNVSWLVMVTSKLGRCSAGPHAYGQGRTTWAVKVRNRFGCSDHEMVAFRNLREGNKVKSKVTTTLLTTPKNAVFAISTKAEVEGSNTRNQESCWEVI